MWRMHMGRLLFLGFRWRAAARVRWAGSRSNAARPPCHNIVRERHESTPTDEREFWLVSIWIAVLVGIGLAAPWGGTLATVPSQHLQQGLLYLLTVRDIPGELAEGFFTSCRGSCRSRRAR